MTNSIAVTFNPEYADRPKSAWAFQYAGYSHDGGIVGRFNLEHPAPLSFLRVRKGCSIGRIGSDYYDHT